MKIEVIYSEAFYKAAHKLKKHYPHVMNDAEALADQLEEGETPGDRVQDVAPHIVYKVRVKNSDIQRGKSGGYRVIYYIQTADEITILTIYSKTKRADITTQEILEIIESLEE